MEGRGRGVFATRSFRKGEVVERSPVIALPGRQWRHVRRTLLSDFPYEWEGGRGDFALVLGLGSLYNHSRRPNVENVNRPDLMAVDWVARRAIRRGEELSVDYVSGDPERGLWFRPR